MFSKPRIGAKPYRVLGGALKAPREYTGLGETVCPIPVVIRLRIKGRGRQSRIATSLLMAVAGIAILAMSIPSWVFFAALGIFLIAGAWQVFRNC